MDIATQTLLDKIQKKRVNTRPLDWIQKAGLWRVLKSILLQFINLNFIVYKYIFKNI